MSPPYGLFVGAGGNTFTFCTSCGQHMMRGFGVLGGESDVVIMRTRPYTCVVCWAKREPAKVGRAALDGVPF